MSHPTLKKNLEHLIKENNTDAYSIEKKAGLKKNNLYHILTGQSKKPSAELLQSLAETLGVSVGDLLKKDLQVHSILKLNNGNLKLMSDVTNSVTQELININLQVSISELFDIFKEVFDYSLSEDSSQTEADKRFIKWIIKEKYQNKNIR